ncbi:MAG: tRNA (adenosine(37)-N6)-threonylcarbamoyltransferase complex dimerization subunit type 1 TsaB [Candidatus Omnitrophica bacterium]|nr:tRNA (adenosine(37)-N6)-threonylcarbamoyltransferase complex dimerization subunit type 1 TsaB [Candidatus Omnitrophota bacterium]
MNVVAIDTSGPSLTVAASGGNDWYVESNCVGILRHSEHLLSLINQVLKPLRLRPEDIDCWAVGKGPGSFTGLRLGWVTMKALHSAIGARCAGFSSLDLIARNYPFSDGRFAVIIDAKRDMVYTRFYEAKRGNIRPLSKETVLTPDALLRRLKKGMVVFGDGCKPYGDFISQRLGNKVRLLGPSTWLAEAHFMLEYARASAIKKQFLKHTELLPKYLRLSGAEEKCREAKSKR